VLTLAALVGPLIVVLGLPGLWLLTLTSLSVNLAGWALGAWTLGDPIVGWWVFGFIAVCTLTSDAMDWLAGVLGARKAGGTKRAMAGAFAGGLAGAIAGTMLLPLLGTLVGGMVGAGAGAMLLHRTGQERTWRQSAVVGAGASAGWIVAVVFKLALSIAAAALLIAAAWTGW